MIFSVFSLDRRTYLIYRSAAVLRTAALRLIKNIDSQNDIEITDLPQYRLYSHKNSYRHVKKILDRKLYMFYNNPSVLRTEGLL
jgi:hypothetical protein